MGGTEEAHTSADARSTTVIVRGFALELPKATPPRSPRTRLANGVHPPAVSYSKKGHSPSSSLGKGRDLDDGLEPFLSDGECAISDSSIGDDDDSSDWESSSDEGAQQFPRVRPEIVSRGSLLTSSLDRHQGAAASAQAAARSGPAMQRSRITSTNDASPTSSVEMSSNYGGGPAISQAVPNRIPGTTTDSLLLSPEWTESLRSACKHEQRSSSYTNEAKVNIPMLNLLFNKCGWI